MNSTYNEQYQSKMRYLDEARKNGRWDVYLFLHERPYQFQVLQEFADEVSDPEFWQLFAECWSGTDNFWQHRKLISDMLRTNRPMRHFMMDEDDDLPDESI